MKLEARVFSIHIWYVIIFFLTPLVLMSQNQKETNNVVKIGLLITDNTSIEAQFAAEFAIREANKKEGPNGKKFELVTRSMEGPWGKGSLEAVNLVFKEKVWAILGSHDGRNAHLVEQVIAKTGTVFMSAWASDPTLSQAFVPWYFSCVPNGNQQADELVKEIYGKRETERLVVISDKSYDADLALKSFLRKVKALARPDPLELYFDKDKNFNSLLDRIGNENIDAIVLFGDSSSSLSFIKELRKNNISQVVFGTLSLLRDYKNSNSKQKQYKNTLSITSGDWFKLRELSYTNEFRKKHGRTPGAVAAYAFDGMNAIIKAIKNADYDRNSVKKSMLSIHFNGLTGSIRFDNKGNRLDAVQLFELD